MVFQGEAVYARPDGAAGMKVGGLMGIADDGAFSEHARGAFEATAVGRAAAADARHVAWVGQRPVAAEAPLARRACADSAVWLNGGYGANGFVHAWGASARVAAEVVGALGDRRRAAARRDGVPGRGGHGATIQW